MGELIPLLKHQAQTLRANLEAFEATLDGLHAVPPVKGASASAELGRAVERLAKHHEALGKSGTPKPSAK
jgi:hypothetical protein